MANISDGGNRAVWKFSADGKYTVGSGNTWFNTPHNLALNAWGNRLFVTHSGALNNRVSVMKVGGSRTPEVVDNVKVGKNPFGLDLVTNTFWPADN